MRRRLCALAVIGLSASACASTRLGPPPPYPAPPPPPRAAVPVTPRIVSKPIYRCPPDTPCAPKEKSPHRQYYDTHHRRYYYFDPATRRYYWEDGQPKV